LKSLFLSLALFATASHGQMQSDWERANEERLKQLGERMVAPPPLERSRLVEVKQDFSASTDFRYFVDWGSVSAGEDRIVRYVLVSRGANGSESVTFEGIRCAKEYRIYAVGRPDGSWGGAAGEWRPIPRSPNAIQPTLAGQYFCPGRAAIRTSEEGQRAVRAGGHPGVFPDSRDGRSPP
jgi:CNP1-like family